MNARESEKQPAPALKPPGAFLIAMEGRAPWEFGVTFATLPWLLNAPRGDGHGVVVFPGLAATDASTLPLRSYLRMRGYDACGWRLRRNYGPRDGVIEESIEQVRKVRKASGAKVSLIGWSLGGVYAREIAKRMPDDVRCVITLATPFAGPPRATNVWWLYELLNGRSLDDRELLAQVAEAPPVPTTSIYSRSDGVVAWRTCIQEGGRRVENIEVPASHFGIGLNPAAWFAVADRLAQPDGQWQPFHREGWRRWFYAEPGSGS